MPAPMWIYLLYYCLACWILSALYVYCRREMFRDLAARRRQRSTRFDAALIVPHFILLAPLLLWWDLITEVPALWRRWRYGTPYHPELSPDYQHVLIGFDEVSPEIAEWWRDATKRLAPLGFSVAGTYSQREASYRHKTYAHMLWHESGTIAFTVNVIESPCKTDWTRELYSVLADGTVVCTVSIARPAAWSLPTAQRDRLHIAYAPRTSAEQIYWWHLREVEELATWQGADVLSFEREQHKALANYHLRNFAAWRQRTANGRPPLEPELPPALRRLSVAEFRTAGGIGELELLLRSDSIVAANGGDVVLSKYLIQPNDDVPPGIDSANRGCSSANAHGCGSWFMRHTRTKGERT